MITRRRFIRDCSLVAATAAAPAALARPGLRQPGLAGGRSLYEHFATALSTSFIVRVASGTVKVVLIEITAGSAGQPNAEDARNERFSLLFRGAASEALEQGTYFFDHSRIGRMAVFIVPLGPADAGASYYEAVFNHAVSPADLAAQLARAPLT